MLWRVWGFGVGNTAIEHALEIANGFVGLPVFRAARGVGSYMTLDVGAWTSVELSGGHEGHRGERSIWIRGAVWRLDVGSEISVDVLSSTDAAIDAAFAGLEGDIVRSISLNELGSLSIDGDDWSLRAFPVLSEDDNWVLFDLSNYYAFSGPNGVIGSNRPVENDSPPS